MVIARNETNMADIDFQGKHVDEKFQFQVHQHWVQLLWPCMKFAIWNTIIFGTAYVVFVFLHVEDAFSRRTVLLLLTSFFILAQFELLARLYRYLLYIVIITDKKVHRIKKTLLFIDDHISFDLWMCQDIQKSQKGFFPNFLGYGSIILEAQDTVVHLHHVPSIDNNYERIVYLREQARALKHRPDEQ